jgi:hypothetical protein
MVRSNWTPRGAERRRALYRRQRSTPPKKVTVNELTTVASAFTAARFINGEAISGNPLGLKIAAGNAPNLVDRKPAPMERFCSARSTSPRTTTPANLNTLGSLIAASFTVAGDDWRNLWAANNWNNLDAVFNPDPARATSTQGGGSGLTIIYGVAVPVQAPRMGRCANRDLRPGALMLAPL